MLEEQDLAAQVRAALEGVGTVREVRMFGGIGFLLNGNLIAGASRRGLLLRVGRDQQAAALAQSGARPMVMRGRTMEGYVYVDPPALDPYRVRTWVQLAIPYVQTLPPKSPRRRKPQPRRPKPSKAARSAKRARAPRRAK